MEALQSFCTVLDHTDQSRFLCFTLRRNGIFQICLTDAADVWSTDLTEDTLNQFRQKFALKSTEDYILKVRTACATGDMSVVLQDTSAELRLGSSPAELSVALDRLEGPRAKQEVKELLFRMADLLPQPATGCGSSSVSPVKNHQRRHKEFEPQQLQQSRAPSVTTKKRLPGASLINPGTKRKREATGVAFDED